MVWRSAKKKHRDKFTFTFYISTISGAQGKDDTQKRGHTTGFKPAIPVFELTYRGNAACPVV